MARPTDWSPVGWSTDPTPGDPAEVAALAQRYATTALRVQTAADGLTRVLTDESYQGDGGRGLRERARDVRDQIVELKDRYETAGEALDAYAQEQNAAQLTADAALSRAVEAEALQQRSTSTLDSLDTPVPPGELEDPAVTTARGTAQRSLDHAESELQNARNAVAEAHRRHDEAGNRAAGRLEEVIGSDGLNDSFTDDVLGLVKQIADVAGIIAAIAGVLSLFLGWVPVLGQILVAVAMLATMVSLLSNLTLVGFGKGSWTDVMWDAISLATFGLGRALAASGKLASVAARGRAWQTARTMVSGNSNSRYRQVRDLLGGPLRQADRSIPLATGQGLLRTGLRAASPRTVVREAVEAGSTARQQWNGVAGLREAWTTMSGGTVPGAFRGLFGAGTAESRALNAIDDTVLSSEAVERSVDLATRLTWSNMAPGGYGLLSDGKNVVELFQSPDVDPESVGVGTADPGLPAGFQAPPQTLAPTPAAP